MRENDSAWKRWTHRKSFQTRIESSIKSNRADSGTSPAEYIARRRSQLLQEIEGQKLIYFDTKHWVNLCHVVVQSGSATPVYDEILGLAETLRLKGRLCCPLSLPMVEELMKQRDPKTRQATAQLMDFLSGGVCLQYWLELARSEFGRHLRKTFRIKHLSDENFPIWTRVGFFAGESGVEFEHHDLNDDELIQKVLFDINWGMTCEELQTRPEWKSAPDEFVAQWMVDCERARAKQMEHKSEFSELVREWRADLLMSFRAPFLETYCLYVGEPASHAHPVAAVIAPFIDGRDHTVLPSLSVVAGLIAAITLDFARKPQVNDLLDYIHAAQAVPYCSAYFCDNFMAQKLRSRPVEVEKHFEITIGSRPDEILGFLQTLV